MISALGRLRVKQQIERLHRMERVVAYVPLYTNCVAAGCGFDPITRTGRNVACTVCGGAGRTVEWRTAQFLARVSWTDVGRPRFGGTVTTEELGDCTVTVPQFHQTMLETVRDAEGGYLLVDGRRLRVMSVDANRVEGKTGTVARCEITRD